MQWPVQDKETECSLRGTTVALHCTCLKLEFKAGQIVKWPGMPLMRSLAGHAPSSCKHITPFSAMTHLLGVKCACLARKALANDFGVFIHKYSRCLHQRSGEAGRMSGGRQCRGRDGSPTQEFSHRCCSCERRHFAGQAADDWMPAQRKACRER
eukprot:scaffold30547_cov18-Tisochrysis_lutea.AAC.1